MIVLNATWQRVALGALLVLLLIPVVAIMAPALPILIWRPEGREFVLALFDKTTELARALVPRNDGGDKAVEGEGLKLAPADQKSVGSAAS
ncbi:hypothetical protein [Nonomuraea jiangxiensis]|uniref:Uncharacterized protein n=1 Tax=Nonomuraea jiangxiensis TaxID=633440 RepID=A0A1G8DCE0_9ACTN|nr:hypothetical protein [Nonomuraea jiangxiensis]SDH55387.1 hypothetical protein SAMN05421869_102532 [Nonomuraea jiangxiensis]